jgi:hypothetical protein
MLNVDTGGADRLALAVVAQYRMATTEQVHLIIAPGVRIEQTRRRLAKLRLTAVMAWLPVGWTTRRMLSRLVYFQTGLCSFGSVSCSAR